MKSINKKKLRLAFAGLIAGGLAACSGDGGSPNRIVNVPDDPVPEVEITGFTSTQGRPTVVDNALYLNDMGANRIVGYAAVPAVDTDITVTAPDFIISNTDGGDGMNMPTSVSGYDNSGNAHLAIADTDNDRVLVWYEAAGAYDGLLDTQPTWIIGTGNDCATDGFRGLSRPQGVFIRNNLLLIADTGNDRVIGIALPDNDTDDVTESFIIGQSSSAVCSNESNPLIDTLYNPTDVWADSNRVIVADSGHNRVLIWQTYPSTGDSAADVVVGQADFVTTDGSGTIENGPALVNPVGASSNGVQLFVADTGNDRVLTWTFLPTTDTPRDADDIIGDGVTALTAPTAVIANNSKVLVNDSGFDDADPGTGRYLIFSGN